ETERDNETRDKRNSDQHCHASSLYPRNRYDIVRLAKINKLESQRPKYLGQAEVNP
ncbi:unnamed protein product, partial [marine sediment metagenome]